MFRFYWLSHKQFQHTVHLNQVLNEYKHSNCIEIDVSLVSFYSIVVAVVVLVIQSYPTLCNPTDCSPPGSSVQGILQARILECSQHHLLKRLSLFHCIFLPPLSKIRCPYVCGFISGLSILFHWSLFLSLCQYHTVLMTVALTK